VVQALLHKKKPALDHEAAATPRALPRHPQDRNTLTASTPEEQRIALFIDFENIAIGVRDAHYRRFDINLVIERLVEKGKILAKRAYADWGRYGEYRRSFHEAAVELIEVPQKSVGGKNSADIRLVVDAMDMSFQKEHIDCFCIASGDSDFSPLVSKLKENDKYVIGLGVKNSTSDLLMENCDEFIFYEDLVRRQEKPAVVIPNIPEKLQEAFSILVDSVVALQLENKGALWGSMVKETMKRKKPSFNETYYGFRSFSSLLEDAQRRGVVTLRRDQKSGSYIVEDLGAAARGDGSIVTPRPSEVDAVMASVSTEGGGAGPSAPSGGSNGPGNGHGNGHRNEPRTDREPRADRESRPERRPGSSAPPMVAGSMINGPSASAPIGSSPSVPSSASSTPDDAVIGTEVETPDGEAPSRPRRRRGGRGRGRGRDGGEREPRPDLEARGEDVPLLPLDEDSNPAIPTPPQAAAAYQEVVERMAANNAPVFSEGPRGDSSALPAIGLPAPPERRPEQVAVDDTGSGDSAAPVAVSKAQDQRPKPPVAPVDPSKASFSLLGWLKGGG
jgi:uncharacterized LabA/DUF88 family protein